MNNIYFTTSSINNWLHLLARPALRDIIVNSLQYMITNGRIILHGYVIMPSHIHLIFTVLHPDELESIFRDFHKFTGQHILYRLRNSKDEILESLESSRHDRKYMIWQEYHAPKLIVSEKIFRQKLEYIHRNPCAKGWQLSQTPGDYKYSSASMYYSGIKGPVDIERIMLDK